MKESYKVQIDIQYLAGAGFAPVGTSATRTRLTMLVGVGEEVVITFPNSEFEKFKHEFIRCLKENSDKILLDTK